MKKRMMLLTAGMVVSAGMAQNVFAEEETGGIKKIAEMIAEAQEITEGTMIYSVSMSLGSTEFSAGTTISMTPDSASMDMLYLSAPNDDGTFFDLVSEDVLRIFGTKAYLNTGLVDDIVSALSEEERIEEDTNTVQAVDSLTEDWIGLTGVKMQEEKAYSGWTQLFSGFAAAHDAGSYTINLGNEQISLVLERLDTQLEEGMFDDALPFDLDELLTPYVDAIIEGRKEADADIDAESASDEAADKKANANEEQNQMTDSNEERDQMIEGISGVVSSFVDSEAESFAAQFEDAVSKGLNVTASICVGKDGAAGTYAFEVTIEADIPQALQEEWGIEDLEPLVGETEGLTAEEDEPDVKNALFNFVVSIEPTEEPIEIDEPEDSILWLTDLLKEWAAQGLLADFND